MEQNTNLQILLSLKDEASAQFKKAGQEMENTSFKLKGSFKGLQTDVSNLAKNIGLGAIAIGGLAAGFGVSAIKAFSDSQVAMARVDATLKSMGASAEQNRDAILAAADAAVKMGFDDEDTAESITKLYQATNDLSKAQQLNGLAMDISRAKNIDLGEANQIVLKAVAGQARELTNLGIKLEENATSAEIIAALQSKYAGQAAEASKTWAVQIESLGIQFTNFKESIGSALVESIMPFITQLNDWASRKETQEKIKEIVIAVGEFAKNALPIAISTIKLWKSAFDGVVDVLSDIILGIENAIAAIGRFASAVKNSAIGKAIGGTVSGAVNEVKYLAGQRADGGPVSSGLSYLVGERGPEIFTPQTSGRIIPNGGGVTVNINGGMYLSEDSARQIGDMIIQQFTRINKL